MATVNKKKAKTKTKRGMTKKQLTALRARELALHKKIDALRLPVGEATTARMLAIVAVYAEQMKARGEDFNLAWVEEQVAEAKRAGVWMVSSRNSD